MWKLSAILILMIGPALPVMAGEDDLDRPATLAAAKARAGETDNPILMEFHRYDCDYCELSQRDKAASPMVKIALKTVVHFPVDVLSDEGSELAARYQVGSSYPVFLLTDSTGEPIGRWIGYTTSERFIESLNAVTSESITIKDREERFESTPTVHDALKLVKYFKQARQQRKVIDYYRQLEALQDGKLDYSYAVMEATAEAVWSGEMPFDSLSAAADRVLTKSESNFDKLDRMAQLVTRVARRTGHADKEHLYRVLNYGLTTSRNWRDSVGVERHHLLMSDWALHVMSDTAAAVQVLELYLGEGFEQNPAFCFKYGQWCLDRRLDLERAESCVRMAAEKASDGKFKAEHLRVLAQIVEARGRIEEAVRIMRRATEMAPGNAWYEELLADMEQNET